MFDQDSHYHTEYSTFALFEDIIYRTFTSKAVFRLKYIPVIALPLIHNSSLDKLIKLLDFANSAVQYQVYCTGDT